MPIYEYQCSDCGQTTEILQKTSDPNASRCENCGGELERLLSAPAIRFKGSGWYVNDYSQKNGKGPASSEPAAKEGKKEGKGEKQSASASESKTASGDKKKGGSSK